MPSIALLRLSFNRYLCYDQSVANGLERAFERAESLRAQGFFTKARPLYLAVLRRARRDDPAMWLEASLGLAAALRSLGDTAEARRWARQGHALAKRLGLRGPAESLGLELVMIDRAEGLFARSLKGLAPFLKAFLSRRDWEGAGFILWAIAGARRFSGDLKGSQKDFERSLALARKAGDDAGQAYALFGLGGITRVRGDLRASERHYSEAGRRLAKTPDVFGKAYAFCGLANSLRQQGRYTEAEALYRKSHVLYTRIGDFVDLAYVDWGLGKVFLQTGRLKEAEKRLRLALAAFAKGKEWRGVALSEMALSGLLHATGRTSEGEKRFENARKVARKAGMRTHLEAFT
jgi:tetratricopeptide (TPR) repeat protein